jgi:hypothetical protein
MSDLLQHLCWGLRAGFIPGVLFGLSVGWDTLAINRLRTWRDAGLVSIYAVLLYGILGSLCGVLIGLLGWAVVAIIGSTMPVAYEAHYSGLVAAAITLQSLLLWKVFVPTSDGMIRTLTGIYKFPFRGVKNALRTFAYIAVSVLVAVIWSTFYAFCLSQQPLEWAGGFLLIALVGTWYLRRKKDEVAIPAALGQRPQTNERRLLLLAMDALEWRVIKDLIQQGKLPNFRFLIENGTSGELQSMIPTWSPSLWTTMATGRIPEKHGVDYFVSYILPGCSLPLAPRREPTHLGATPLFLRLLARRNLVASLPITSNIRREPAFWNIASFFEKTVSVIGWYATWPVEKINGSMVTEHAIHAEEKFSDDFNYFTPEGSTYPAGLLEQIKPFILHPSQISDADIQRFFSLTEEELQKFHGVAFEEGKPEPFFKMVYAQDKSYENIAHHIWHEQSPDLLAVYLQGIDYLSHLTMQYFYRDENEVDVEECRKYGDVLSEYYDYYDGIIGSYLEELGEDTTMLVVSDHGFERMGEAYYHHKDAPPGAILAYGAGIGSGHKITGGRIIDVAPTLLYCLGLPLAEEMEGEVLTELFEPDSVRGGAPWYIPSYNFLKTEETQAIEYSETDEKIKVVLRGLGYID